MKNFILLTFTAFLILNCSSRPSYQEFPTTASPKVELDRLDQDLDNAQNAQADILSPKNFEMSVKYYKDAKEGIKKQASAKSSLNDIAQSRAYLQRALNFTSLSRSNLSEVISARDMAIDAQAKNYDKKRLNETDELLVEVTEDIEKNELESSIKRSASLQEKYLDIELFSIKRKNLDQPRATIELAEKEGAQEFAPRSLALAKKEVADFDAFLTANRHQESEINRYQVSTQKSADHLLKITRESKSGKLMSSEDIALRSEGQQDIVVAKQSQLDRSQKNLRNSQRQNTEYIDQNELDKRYEAARKTFNANEAEVYKQGNTLAIRLKGIQFPVSTAIIRNESYPLLAKVQKVISDFNQSSIVIEGHTDSVGGKLANESLSLDRARAVQNYLVSNQTGQPLEIESVGYGFQKPLGSNKTAAGRAQNRRVDVLITPRI